MNLRKETNPMKMPFLITALCLTAFANSGAQRDTEHKISPFKPYITYKDHTAISVDHGDVLIYDKNNEDDVVEITEDNQLFIRNRRIQTSAEQQELTREYRRRVIHIKHEVNKIAYEGAKIGLDGAKIGLKAVAGVFKLILPEYDSEDLERDMDAESSKIEAKAGVLEERAEKIESSVAELEELHDQLREQIKELNELEWF
jgi:hypothetical protein